MTRKIEVKYSFESKAEILDKQSEKIREYKVSYSNSVVD